ncbi:MAG: SIMPL domain-containing protein [Candidatus Pacebacteria bacterium]|jgi:uncharacterized protein|nr:SIMPL domain-containing protein [Candidatus Paceibacterota bacterium]MBT3512099.1 SIMPL domain-containing protein [Candidatus Paceibacterota bacterium]MBT4005218.1 SIMPL domain-containing protein [Candidatus Paceibacterota bacterium]MBT4358362.1 SIMPL domain-containing protein [Candidatus Paceibacterota bacterium]MBT4680778.1 SIMPL domain-containing protein [Candidatus Paceibacterota bacterium]
MKNYFNARTIINAILVTAVTVGAGILVTRLTGPLPISVTQTLSEKQTTFNTTGDSEMSVIPDEARVYLGIDVGGQTVAEAQSEANEVINSITTAVKKLGVDEKNIKTQNYSLNPNYDYESPERTIIGYRVNTQILVKINDFEKLNQVIDTATNLGANQVGGINFSLSEDKQEELRKEARKEAIDEAKENAKELAKLAGIKLGKVVNITESNGGNYPQPLYARAEMALDGGGLEAPTQINPGSETYRYSVTLSYETL